MAAQVSLEQMLAARTLWHAGRQAEVAPDGEPTGFAALDALLPQRGWPRRALTELLLPADGVGELALLLPTLARLTRAGGTVAVVAPPYLAYAPAWQAAAVELSHLQLIDAAPRDALWAFEQCLRSGACDAVLGWPAGADAQSLRRLQVAADSGRCLGFALRDRRHAANPSPAALRLEAVRETGASVVAADRGIVWRVRKCRGGPVSSQAFVVGAEPEAVAFPSFPASAQPAPSHAPADAPSPACGGGLGWGPPSLELNGTQPLPPASIPSFPRSRGKDEGTPIPARGKAHAASPMQRSLHLVQGPAPAALG